MAGPNLPHTLADMLGGPDNDSGQEDWSGPIPTGFNPLDKALDGGMRPGELVVLGGADGIGKTIAALQMARNIVTTQPDLYAFYLTYQHTATHLVNRLVCLESVNPPEMTLDRGLRMKDLQDLAVSTIARQTLNGGSGESLPALLRRQEQSAPALARMSRYAEQLSLLTGSSAVTTVAQMRDIVARLAQATQGRLILFVDILQKVGIYPETARDEDERVTIVAEGLKELALSLDIPVLAVFASHDERLKTRRLRLADLSPGSALSTECDIALIMNNKAKVIAEDPIAVNPYEARRYRDRVVFSIEKNRAGRAMIDIEFQLEAPFFCFDPNGHALGTGSASAPGTGDDDPPLVPTPVLA